jgi:hypothetical protein
MSNKITKATPSLYPEGIKAKLKDSTIPRTKPPRIAPLFFPQPPRTAAIKPFRPKSAPEL